MGCDAPCDVVIRVYDSLMEKFYKNGIIFVGDESSLGLKPQDDKKNDQNFQLVFGIAYTYIDWAPARKSVFHEVPNRLVFHGARRLVRRFRRNFLRAFEGLLLSAFT
jgi:hypothetical protein